MTDKKRIADTESVAEMLGLIQGASAIEGLWQAFPLLQQAFPQLSDFSGKLMELKEQSKILLLPDRFNEIFASSGWIAYESMSMDVMKKAIDAFEAHGLEAAEDYLVSTYDADTLKWGILRFNGHDDFRKRVRLVELAKDDYLAGRYHACTPVLLSLMDGLANDVSRHVGLFADNADLTAWDCIAAHESGLQTLVALMTKGRNKTSEESISVPFRHGILHGRELAFDNRIVAAKTWAALFAIRDWAEALAEGKKMPAPKQESTWSELLQSLNKTQETKRLLDVWKPREKEDFSYLPCDGLSSSLLESSPECMVAEFMENWRLGRFAPLADSFSHTYDMAMGKKAGEARQDFGKYKVVSFQIVDVEDRTPAYSTVTIRATFSTEDDIFEEELKVSAGYQDKKGLPMCRLESGGKWTLVQNSFRSVINRNAQ
ncbi:hypothetical protein AZ16_1395 [Bordetella bronchiseptica B18-5 (C3)]|uniref:hypothetical protein n=1 Tax=Bordetella bronchiseptica TaxID=518 RepID=UPI000461B1C0|nr:hypothetical protein [Bordetella bronchiseptica]KDB58604.1 hypothetical protein AZ16_1395 [Bordetella bronchiseptica B18-5 (C3)]KDD86350.1 hypothetical protein L524_0755 [Bordetella bronchiseptica MBORD762]